MDSSVYFVKRNELKMSKSSVTFRRALSAAFVAVNVFATIPADAAPFPEKAIRMVVAFPPGGGGDFMARIMGEKLGEAWRHPVITDNRPGASATIGAAIAAKAPADGYTLFLVTTELVIAPNFVRSLTYDPVRSFAPITQTGRQSYIVAAHPSLGVSTVKELIATLKTKNGRVNFGSAGAGSPGHLSGELFKLSTGTQMTHIPYKGSGPALTALFSGETSVMFSNSLPVLPHIRSGRLRAIAITSRERLANLPDLPTVAESGLPGFETSGWTGIVAPAGTPTELIEKFHRQLVIILAQSDLREQFARGDIEPIGNSPLEFGAHIAREQEKWAKVVKQAGLVVE